MTSDGDPRVSARVTSGAVVLPSPCWLWHGATSADGYGSVSDGARVVKVHRLAWESANDQSIPDGWEVDHICFNRRCVNPAHLEAVPRDENQRRRVALISHCPQGHPYDDANTTITSRGGRRCRECQRRWTSESARRRKEIGA